MDLKEFARLAFVFLGTLFLGFLIGAIFSAEDYKKGQIDCINGKIFYELVVTESKESEWQPKENDER